MAYIFYIVSVRKFGPGAVFGQKDGPIHKKGYPANPDNFRLLSLTSLSSKVLLYSAVSPGWLYWLANISTAGGYCEGADLEFKADY